MNQFLGPPDRQLRGRPGRPARRRSPRPHFPAPGRALGLDAAPPTPAAFLASPWAPRPADRASARLPRQAFPGRRPGSGEGELPPHPALPQTGVRAASSRGQTSVPEAPSDAGWDRWAPSGHALCRTGGGRPHGAAGSAPGLIRKIPPRSERPDLGTPQKAGDPRELLGFTAAESPGTRPSSQRGQCVASRPAPHTVSLLRGAGPCPPQAPGAAPALAPVSLLPSTPWPPTLGAEWGALGWWRAFPPVWHTQLHLRALWLPSKSGSCCALDPTQVGKSPDRAGTRGLGSAAGTPAGRRAGEGRGDLGQQGPAGAGWSAASGCTCGSEWAPAAVRETPAGQHGAGLAQSTDDKKRRESVSGSKSQFC